ncbi:hypothetical protein ACOMCU_16005 [Lysinibacillus sp. UGB7]|uniref:hypothetical protein n=1 Tax=Lysinibacillus sp. UGB7 TaxID=3411039 RepID=UPI003B779ADE
MNLIIATSNTEFAKSLRDNLKNDNCNVLDIVSCVEDLITSMSEHSEKVDGILLKTDLAKKNDDYRLEVLSDVVLSIRKTPQFEKVIFTVLSDYAEGHPLLAEFFEMGIYNFFTRNGIEFTINHLVDSFNTPMSFSMALKYRAANKEIPWRRDLTKPQSLEVKFISSENGSDKDAKVNGEERNVRNKNEENVEPKKPIDLLSKAKTSKSSIAFPKFSVGEKIPSKDQINDDWIFEKSESSNISKIPVVGTVIIGVASVEKHLGATNTAISIAKFISKAGNNVALVEGNKNMDFDRMHSLIEGEKITLSESEFNYKGFTHIKYRDDMDLGKIYTGYQFVVLDLGDIRNSPFRNEFNRSHIKCVIASADEWKFHWIEEFMLNIDATDDLVLLIPSSDYKAANDLESRWKKHVVYPLEKHSNPYEVPEESGEVYEQLLRIYLDNHGFRIKKKHLLLTALLGALISAIGFIFFI